jgi:hypothetical protein
MVPEYPSRPPTERDSARFGDGIGLHLAGPDVDDLADSDATVVDHHWLRHG